MLIQWISNLLAFLFGISNGHHPASRPVFCKAGLDWKAIARVAASIDDLQKSAGKTSAVYPPGIHAKIPGLQWRILAPILVVW